MVTLDHVLVFLGCPVQGPVYEICSSSFTKVMRDMVRPRVESTPPTYALEIFGGGGKVYLVEQ